MAIEQYHQQLRETKKSAAMAAASELFLSQGYKNTSLQQIAKRADVSTATLFKNFPTKAALLEAIVEDFWQRDRLCGSGEIPTDEPSKVLFAIGLDYARRMRSEEMQAFYRLVISEAVDFPDLGDALYDKGKGSVIEKLTAYFTGEKSAGRFSGDASAAANQFLAVIAGQVFWPELITKGCGGSEVDVERVVTGAADLVIRRYFRPENR
jgi:TetR/AcrR family transcriptional regulator of autoinduction and epiphytic fitness